MATGGTDSTGDLVVAPHMVAPEQSPGRPERLLGLGPSGLTGMSGGLVIQRSETTSAWNDDVDRVVGPPGNATRHAQN